MKKYYKILGLPTNASHEEVRNARNNLLKKYHPDCYQGSTSFAENKTAEINEAFEKVCQYLEEQEKDTRARIREKIERQKQKQQEVFSSAKKTKKKPVKEIKEEKVNEKPEEEIDLNLATDKFEYIQTEKPCEKTKKKLIAKTMIEDESKNKEKQGKKFLDITIYGLVLLIVILVVLFFTGVIR